MPDVFARAIRNATDSHLLDAGPRLGGGSHDQHVSALAGNEEGMAGCHQFARRTQLRAAAIWGVRRSMPMRSYVDRVCGSAKAFGHHLLRTAS
jgi:hypothetical protein